MADTRMQTEPKATAKRVDGKQPGEVKVPRLLQENDRRGRPGFAKDYGFGLVTAAPFLLSWTGQFLTQLVTVRNEAEEHGQPFA